MGRERGPAHRTADARREPGMADLRRLGKRGSYRLGRLGAQPAAGWGAALWWLVRGGLPEGAVAREIAALAGLPAHAAVAVAITLLVAVIQAVAGLWLGRALTPGRSAG